MHIRYGFHIELACDVETPLISMLDVHPDARLDITDERPLAATALVGGAPVPAADIYRDQFDNLCRRLKAPAGGVALKAEGVLHHHGFAEETPDRVDVAGPGELPAETLAFLLPSRYCETEKVQDLAWRQFGALPTGSDRVHAVCDYVHRNVSFGYHHARGTRTAAEVLDDRVGVCRDFAHLAVALCRALNIPARYCTGYLGDIGVPADPNPMDFSAWFEAYLGDQWWTFDARHNTPRIGRILIARGRDAADVPILHSFGKHVLTRFDVVTEEVTGSRFPVSAAGRRRHAEVQGHIRAQG
jgi:transglutaminase-like putative cysteine protease